MSSVTGIIARTGALSSKTNTGGVLNAAAVTFFAVASGFVGVQLVLYRDSGAGDATSEVILVYDTAGSLPVTTNGGAIVLQFDPGANKVGAI